MRTLLLIAVVAFSTAGCGIIYKQPIYQGNLIKKSAVDQLQVGQSKQAVEALLGSPSIPDPFHAERWDYTATQRVDRLAHVEKKNFTVFFENDQVVRWEGDYFADQDQALAKAAPKQFGRNLAKDKKGQRGR